MIKASQKIKIILVEPAGPLNLGSIARLCENFGVEELRLVRPCCNKDDPEAKKMAVKGKEILEQAKTYSSLLDAIHDCPLVIATAGRLDHGEIPLSLPEQAFESIINSFTNSNLALIFGRESSGLTNQELLIAHKVIRLPTQGKYPSLNISHAVAIVLYELHCFKEKQKIGTVRKEPKESPANQVQLESFLEDAKELLLEIGFLLPHTSEARMSKIRSFFQRAYTRNEEVSLFRGIIRQLRWAIKRKSS